MGTSDQKGSAALEVYISLIVVMMFFLIMVATLIAVVQLGDSRADAQQVAEFIERRFRDDGCITAESRRQIERIANATGLGYDRLRLEIDGNPSGRSEPYANGELVQLELFHPINITALPDRLTVGTESSVSFPVYSQYVSGSDTQCVSIP